MTKYFIRVYNPIGNFWSIHHSTYDISDAYNTHRELISRGCQAAITSQYVSEPS